MSNQTQELSLEELIYQVDASASDEYNQPLEPSLGGVNPPEDPTISDPFGSDDPEEPEEEILPEPTKVVETSKVSETPKSAVTTTPEEIPEQQPNIYQEYYNILQDNDMLFVPEDFQFDGTAESLEKALVTTKENLGKAAAQSLIERFPSDFKPVLNYVLQGGQNVGEFLQATSTVDIEDLPIDSAAGQKAILREYFKSTTDYDDAKINRLIDRSELADSLYEDAQEALADLKVQRQQLAAELTQRAAKEREEAQRVEEESRRKIFTLIDDAEYIKTGRKGKVKAFMFNKLTKNNNEVTGFQDVIHQISANPEHLVQLADILLHYDPKKGIDLSRFVSQSQTKANDNLRTNLEKLSDTRTKVTGDGSKVSAASFD